jgi:hypothetical protein
MFADSLKQLALRLNSRPEQKGRSLGPAAE